MKKSKIIGVQVLLLAAAATWGCAADVDPEGLESGETTGTEEQELPLSAQRWDPIHCNAGVTVCNGMHCCGPGEAMTGVHANNNVFECKKLTLATDQGCAVYPLQARANPTEGVAVGACPEGHYMKGYHRNHNNATCCPYPGIIRASSWTLDGRGEPATQGIAPRHKSPWPFAGTCSGLSTHVCPPNSVMEGIHVGSNYLLCGT